MAWRPTGPAPLHWRVALPGGSHADVALTGDLLQVDDRSARVAGTLDGQQLLLTVDGVTSTWTVAVAGGSTHLAYDGSNWALSEQAVVLKASAAAAGGQVRSPMPGAVIAVHVATGDTVTAGQALVVVEAMKMEHTLTAALDGIADVLVRVGQQVKVDELLATVSP